MLVHRNSVCRINIYHFQKRIKNNSKTILISLGGEKEMTKNNGSSNKLLVPGVQEAVNQMKYEIAQEFGVQLGGEASSRSNGSVGGEITKRLVQMAQEQSSQTKDHS